MEKGVLGKSRKYINGSIHENASGKFMILDRYLGDDNKPWLKYQWLSGSNEGKVEENKEENINASLYKYKVSRGIKEPIEMVPQDIVTPNQIFQLVEENNRILNIYEEDRRFITNQIQELQKEIIDKNQIIEQLSKLVDHNSVLIQQILERDSVVAKLVDKL